MQAEYLAIMTVMLSLLVPGGVACVALGRQRARLAGRCARLEESLRVFSSANVAMGRHLSALESELRDMRERLASVEGTRLRARLRGEAPAATEPEGACADAERRLSQLIRSRLGEIRAG